MNLTLFRVRRHAPVLSTMLLLSIAWCSSALASGSDMPWEEPLNQILESV